MSSSCDSLKSVVMCGWVSAEPSASGCAVIASLPSGRTRRLSFSMPRRMPFSVVGERARSRSWILFKRECLSVRAPKVTEGLFRFVMPAPGAVLFSERCDHCGDKLILGPTFFIRIDAGAHDHQIVAGHDRHVLALVARGGKRTGGPTPRPVPQPEMRAGAPLAPNRRAPGGRRGGEIVTPPPHPPPAP